MQAPEGVWENLNAVVIVPDYISTQGWTNAFQLLSASHS